MNELLAHVGKYMTMCLAADFIRIFMFYQYINRECFTERLVTSCRRMDVGVIVNMPIITYADMLILHVN